MAHPARTHLAANTVAAAMAIIVLAQVGVALEGLNAVWSLSLRLGPGVNSGGVQAFATDGEAIYSVNPDGTLFAVNATSGRVLWSAPDSNAVSQILWFAEFPELVYVASQVWFQQMTVQAVRRKDGHVVGLVSNLTGVTPGIAVAGENRLALQHHQGILVTDRFLTPIWRVDGHPETSYFYNWIGANADVVATFYYSGLSTQPLPTNAVSFSARTGAVICNITNVTFDADSNWGLPFAITPRNYSIVGLQEGQFYTPHWRLVDFGRCKLIRTAGINNDAVGELSMPFIVNGGKDNELFVNFNLTNGTWVVTASPVSDKPQKAFLWSHLLRNVGDSIASWDQFPLLGPVPLNDGVVAVWVNTSLLSIIDSATGEVRWRLPRRVAASPSLQNEFVFPLRSSRFLVPTADGYVIFNELRRGIEVDVSNDPAFGSGAVFTLLNATDHSPFVVYIDPQGDLVAVN